MPGPARLVRLEGADPRLAPRSYSWRREAEELCCLLKSAVGRTALAFPCRPWSAGLLQPGSAGVDVARVGVGHKGKGSWGSWCGTLFAVPGAVFAATVKVWRRRWVKHPSWGF